MSIGFVTSLNVQKLAPRHIAVAMTPVRWQRWGYSELVSTGSHCGRIPQIAENVEPSQLSRSSDIADLKPGEVEWPESHRSGPQKSDSTQHQISSDHFTMAMAKGDSNIAVGRFS